MSIELTFKRNLIYKRIFFPLNQNLKKKKGFSQNTCEMHIHFVIRSVVSGSTVSESENLGFLFPSDSATTPHLHVSSELLRQPWPCLWSLPVKVHPQLCLCVTGQMCILFSIFPQFQLVSVTRRDLNHERPVFMFFLVSSISLLINTFFFSE